MLLLMVGSPWNVFCVSAGSKGKEEDKKLLLKLIDNEWLLNKLQRYDGNYSNDY